MLFAPLYWIAPAPETLIIAQGCLFALSIVPVFLYMRHRLTASAAIALCVAYAFFWGLQRAAAFDVHEAAFAPLVIATAILAMDRRRWDLFWIAAIAMMLVKEDLLPLLVVFGADLIMLGERRRGIVLASVSLCAFIVVVRVVVPAFNDSGEYGYTNAYEAVLQRPWIIPALLVTPRVKLETAFLWVAPFAFMPLWSPLVMLVVPLAAERFLSSSPNQWGTVFHYSAPLAPILAMSAGDGLARILRRIQKPTDRVRVATTLTCLSILCSAILPGHQPHWRLFLPDRYRQTSFHATGYRALEHVPTDASVVAQAAVVPHISERDRIYVLARNAGDADFVVAARGLSPWPAASYQDLAALIETRRQQGYREIFNEQGWVVLRASSYAIR